MAKDVPPYAIVVGNPARIVKYRFDSETVAKLLAIRWWEWPEDQIEKEAGLIWSVRVAEFVARHGSDVSDGIQGAASIPAVKTVEEVGKAAPMSDQSRVMAHPRVMFASYRGLDDQTDGMISVRNLFAALTGRGWRCGIFTGPAPNNTAVLPTMKIPPEKPEGWIIRGEIGGVKFSVRSRSVSIGCSATEFEPDRVPAGQPSLAEKIAAFMDVFSGAAERFRPEIVLICGDDPANAGITTVARLLGVKVACWLLFDGDVDSQDCGGYDAIIVPLKSNRPRDQAFSEIKHVPLPRLDDQADFALNLLLWEEFLNHFVRRGRS
ncbi:hypothetical protein [Zavarzinella formosa]|uniref:hypothetical protein n=1 Tax=Zavarzinella formosa TaxID=360055 RepID=UPI001EE68601|nr:hypothetical protein [Zavarzinella formosa]